MSAFEVYADYVALYRHFTSDYDYHKYNGKVRLKSENFNRRPDRFSFEKLAKRYEHDYHDFILSNMAANPKTYIKTLATSLECEEIYLNWRKRAQSLTYTFKNDLTKISNNANRTLGMINGRHPELLEAYLGDGVCLETVCIMLSITGGSLWDKIMNGDPVWDSVSLRVKKYTPFLTFDVKRMQQIALERFML